MIKVSIIIPIYNVSQYIEECIDSVLSQDYQYIQCIIVNDCTLDNSIELIENKLSDYLGPIEFKILHQEKNRGAAAARNAGVRAADGDYIYFLDSDDTITPNCISLLSGLAEKYKGVDIVQGNIECENPLLNTLFDISKKRFPAYSSEHQWIKENFLLNIPVSPCNRLIRKQFVEANELWFKEDIVQEDVLWRFFIGKYVKSVAFNMAYSYYYRDNPVSVTTSDCNNRTKVISHAIVLKNCLDNIDPDMKYMQCLCILKDFHWGKTAKILPKNKKMNKRLFSGCVRRAMKSNNVPLVFKPMFIFLLLPRWIVKNMNFFWLKGLGILYRYAKYKDKTMKN